MHPEGNTVIWRKSLTESTLVFYEALWGAFSLRNHWCDTLSFLELAEVWNITLKAVYLWALHKAQGILKDKNLSVPCKNILKAFQRPHCLSESTNTASTAVLVGQNYLGAVLWRVTLKIHFFFACFFFVCSTQHKTHSASTMQSGISREQ